MNSLPPDSQVLQFSNETRCQANDALRWRCIGPPRGGRVVAVAGHPSELMTFYFGACAGGVWKTDDGGTYWENISDGYFNSASIGALTVSESDPNVIYAGTGETTIRLDVSYGDGIYKSVDGGKNVEPHRFRRDATYRRNSCTSQESRLGLCGSVGTCVRPKLGARGLSFQGWREKIGRRCCFGVIRRAR